jgi:hypothetical protein
VPWIRERTASWRERRETVERSTATWSRSRREPIPAGFRFIYSPEGAPRCARGQRAGGADEVVTNGSPAVIFGRRRRWSPRSPQPHSQGHRVHRGRDRVKHRAVRGKLELSGFESMRSVSETCALIAAKNRSALMGATHFGSRSHRCEAMRPSHRVRRYLGEAPVSARVVDSEDLLSHGRRDRAKPHRRRMRDARPTLHGNGPYRKRRFEHRPGARFLCHGEAGHVDRATGGSVVCFVQILARRRPAPSAPRSKHASASDALGARSLAGHSRRAARGLVPASGAHRPLHRRFRRVSAARDHRGGWRLSHAASLSRSAPAALARETGVPVVRLSAVTVLHETAAAVRTIFSAVHGL